MDVIDAVIGKHLQEDLHHRLANVRGGHRWQRETDVIESDGHLHSRPELRVERIAAERVKQSLANRSSRVG
jgi:hypothetical protein